MTIGNALSFIERGLHDSGLRNKLNSASNAAECQKVLDDEKLTFSAHDFDEAFRHRLTQCQEEGEADQLREFKMWGGTCFPPATATAAAAVNAAGAAESKATWFIQSDDESE